MQFGFKITIIILQKSVCAAFYSQIRQATSVIECTCTLCYCTLYVTLSLSLVFSSFGCGGGLWHHLIVIILLHVLHVILDTTKRCEESTRDSERRCQWPLADTIRKEKNKSVISGCGSLVVAYFQPATSTIYTGMRCWGQICGAKNNPTCVIVRKLQ